MTLRNHCDNYVNGQRCGGDMIHVPRARVPGDRSGKWYKCLKCELFVKVVNGRIKETFREVRLEELRA